MAFGAFTRSQSARQLWRRSATRTPPAGRGLASLVLGSDAEDEAAVLQSGDGVTVAASGNTNDAKLLQFRGAARFNEAPPPGYAWEISFGIGASFYVYTFGADAYDGAHFPAEYSLSDAALNIAGLVADPYSLSISLALALDGVNPGPAAVDVEVVLPSVYIDQILAPEMVANDLLITNRQPAPGQVNTPSDLGQISFRLADTVGTGIDLTTIDVTVDGAAVMTAGAYVFPWTGTVVGGVGPSGDDVDVTLYPPAALLPFASEQAVEVNVQAALTGPVSPIDETWGFVIADTIQPAVKRAAMIAKDVLRVQFTDDVLLDTSTHGALNPANYSTVRMSAPAVTLDVVSVAAVAGATDMVDISFNWEASLGAAYALIVQSVKDDGGNIISSAGQELAFIGYVPPRPRGRRFDLLDFVPGKNKAEDRTTAQGGDPTNPGTGDLRKFVLVLQDVADVLLCSIDRWSDIVDIDLAPEQFLDAMLQDMGNPFADCIADLDESGKRRLARILISIYKQKGTAVGVINAVRFFVGVEVTLDIINYRTFWELDIALLGIDTILAPPVGSPLWYSFFVVSPALLTDEQRERILCIAEYMKAAHEHVLGVIEPGGGVTLSDYWTLDVSLLGAAAAPSTVLA